MNNDEIYHRLKTALKTVITDHRLAGHAIDIQCRALSAREAIGTPEHEDYPIIKGREVMIEARFLDAAGQAFTDEYRNTRLPVEALLEIDHRSTPERAWFVAGLNAVFRHLGLCEKTVHCRDQEPVTCAGQLLTLEGYKDRKILLAGLQPRFLEYLLQQNQVRVVDLDPDNVGQERFGVRVEPVENTAAAMAWADLIFATGSTLVNGTMGGFLDQPKPVVFFGVTISAAAGILGLESYCHCGH
jgi:hypothetical protein